MVGDSEEDPKLVNLAQPVNMMTRVTINGMQVDMHKLKEAADRLGADKYDVLSIGGYRNAKGVLIPDYDSVKIERRQQK